jgi:hypothetical protein
MVRRQRAVEPKVEEQLLDLIEPEVPQPEQQVANPPEQPEQQTDGC